MPPLYEDVQSRDHLFEPTHWTVVLQAASHETAPEAAQAALAELCQTYWTPLYGFIRSRGCAAHDAQDLTQSFFAHLIGSRLYQRSDRGKGKFRSFLLASVKNFMADAYDRRQTQKRGGGITFLPLDGGQAAGSEGGADPPAEADRTFERQWAESLINAALARLKGELEAEGKERQFAALEGFVAGSGQPPLSYETAAADLGISTATARSQVTRLRERYRAALRAELRRTVGSDREVEEELRELLRILLAR